MSTATFAAICAAVLALATGAGAASAPPAFAGCGTGAAHVRPVSIVVACGDGNFYLTRIVWSQWSDGAAAGTSVGHQNLCSPTCAAGRFRTYPVAVRLSRPETCEHGQRLFTELRWVFIAGKPQGVARTGIERLPFPNRRCP